MSEMPHIPKETQQHLDNLIGTHLILLLFDANRFPIGYVTLPIEDKEGNAEIFNLHRTKVGEANWFTTPIPQMVALLLQKKTETYIT